MGLGGIWLTNAHRMNNYKSVTYEQGFKIYKINRNSDGTVDYWTTDNGNGQTVLFELNQSGATEKLTMSRYSSSTTVSKRIIYYLE